MNQFNQNVATVLSHLREVNYTGRNIRMYELFYKKSGAYLIQIGEKYSPSSGSVYIQNIQKSKHQQLYFEKSAVAKLNDVYNTGEIKGIHLSITSLGRTVLLTSQCLEQVDEYLKKVSSVYSNSQLYNIKRRIIRFLKYMNQRSKNEFASFSYEDILEFHENLSYMKEVSRTVEESSVKAFLGYLEKIGAVHFGLSLYLGVNVEKNEILKGNDEKPWAKVKDFHLNDVDGIMKISLADAVYIDTVNLKPRIQNQIRELAAFSNPIFYKNQAMGLSNFENARYIYFGRDENGYIRIPRGLFDQLVEMNKKAAIPMNVEDKRCVGTQIKVFFNGQLKDSQVPAVEALEENDTGILNAATAFGKTVVYCNMIARKKVNTLILLQSSSLMEQWMNAIESFLIVDEEPAEYHKRLRNYGMIILDECHHAASATIVDVLQEVCAKYVYGVTATPFRGDGMEKINYMLLGPVRYRFTSKDRAKEQGIGHLVCPRFTRAVAPRFGNDNMHPNEAYAIIRKNDDRDELIINDVKKCIDEGRTPVILSKYVDHSKRLHERLTGYADKIFLLSGSNSKKEHRGIVKEMNQVQSEESMILIATGKLIGEGFNFPRLDTLIMATPVAWKGVVEQYAGRLNRVIYDYVDSHIPMFDRMYYKRLKAYKQIGYDIYSENSLSREQGNDSINAIYDLDTYLNVYQKDMLLAKNEIILSSPAIGGKKVEELVELLKEKQLLGLHVVIVTWKPDMYGYGDNVYWMELQERMRRAGFVMNLVEDYCNHYCIVDKEIVWYGSMNFLGKEDSEDNLMRICSKRIASELLELTFGKEKYNGESM